MSDKEKKNEWHEQVDFSDLFFKSTKICRDFQIRGDLPAWRNALTAKISLVSGILEGEQVEELYQYIKELRNIDFDYSVALKNNPRSVGRIKAKYSDVLFGVEQQLDFYVNQKMPFLNIKEQRDSSTW